MTAVISGCSFGSLNTAFADENASVTKLDAVSLLSRVLPAWNDAPVFDDTYDKTAAYYRSMKILDAEYNNVFMPETSAIQLDASTNRSPPLIVRMMPRMNSPTVIQMFMLSLLIAEKKKRLSRAFYCTDKSHDFMNRQADSPEC